MSRQALRRESDLAIRLTLVMTADLDRHFPVKPFEKIEQLVRGESAEMAIHQVRHVWLRNAQDSRDFALFQLLILEDLEDVKTNLRPRIELVRIVEPQIGKDVAGAFLKLN
jgi:hypothetical protein